MTVNCRVGSLEIVLFCNLALVCVNCRVGSLESNGTAVIMAREVNCRVGSLEIVVEQERSAA